MDKPEGVPVAQLAALSGLQDSDKLGRMMRLLATRHIFREVRPGVYANNRLSVKLTSSNPMSDLVGLVYVSSTLLIDFAFVHFQTEPKSASWRLRV